MINDHSEVMSTLNSKISELNQTLNDKNHVKARILINTIIADMDNLWQWTMEKDEEK